jgi:hypothetical protein
MRKKKGIEMGNPRENICEDRMNPAKDEIRQRAYEIFQARSGEPGHGLDDWLQADRELKQEVKAIT